MSDWTWRKFLLLVALLGFVAWLCYGLASMPMDDEHIEHTR